MRKTVRALTASVLCLLAAVLASCGNSAEVSVADTKPADNRPVTVGCEFAARAKDTSVTRDDVTVEPIAYQEEDKYWYLYLLITNKSGEMLHLSGDVVFYDPKGKQIDKAYSNAIAVEDGTTVYLDFTSNGQYSSFEYKIEEFVPVEDFQPIDKDIAVDFSLTPTSVKVSAENKGERVSMNNKYLALFYSDGKLTHVSEETCAEENGVIEPGETAENECQYYGVGTPDKARVFFHAYSTAVAAVRE